MATLVSKKTAPSQTKSALLGKALARVAALPRNRQDAIAVQILEALDHSPAPDALRHQALIEKKYTQGLTSEDAQELAELEAGFDRRDEAFYAPILERVAAARKAPPKGK
jgi:hypothetical protein